MQYIPRNGQDRPLLLPPKDAEEEVLRRDHAKSAVELLGTPPLILEESRGQAIYFLSRLFMVLCLTLWMELREIVCRRFDGGAVTVLRCDRAS